MEPTPNYHAQGARYAAQMRERSRQHFALRERSAKRIAERAADHRAKAEACLGLSELRGNPKYAADAAYHFEMAYGEEN